MPIIARFYGIIIKMYFIQSEYNPPHIHAFYGGDVAAISLLDLKIISGSLPPKAIELVLEWLRIHQLELIKMWKTQKISKLDGLA